MRVKTFHLLMAYLVFCCAIGLCTGNVTWSQVVETPTETPVETPTETPTIAPTATNTPLQPSPTATESAVATPSETPTETPTATAVPPTPTNTAVATPEVTPTESASATPEVTPTESASATPEVTPTESATATPPATATPVPPTATPTPAATGVVTPIPVFTPSPTPTALVLSPFLGFITLDHLGGTYPSGNAVHNLDVGISNRFTGELVALGAFDGLPDPITYAPFLFLFFMDGSPDGTFIPIARDLEFSGETLPVDQGGNGSEGAYFLIGGNIGPYPPVNVRLGATGGPNRGGIDTDNNPANNLNLGTYSGDIVQVFFQPSTDPAQPGRYLAPLVDVEPAGNDGFYVLSETGRIFAEGGANEALDNTVVLSPNARAVALKIFRGRPINVANSQYSTELDGTGAYVLDNNGGIAVVGGAPALNTANLPIIESATMDYRDLEFIPSVSGTDFIGLGVMNGDGMITFVPFSDVTVTPEIEAHVRRLSPFGSFRSGFPIDLARNIEVEISDRPVYMLSDTGETITRTTRRMGTFMFDGFGGVHTGGDATRFAPAFIGGGPYTIEGQPAVAFPVQVPYFGADVVVDVEVAPPVNRQ